MGATGKVDRLALPSRAQSAHLLGSSEPGLQNVINQYYHSVIPMGWVGLHKCTLSGGLDWARVARKRAERVYNVTQPSPKQSNRLPACLVGYTLSG